MKVREFVELISKTQDNNVLTKEFAEDDHISLLLLKIVKNNTSQLTGNVDVNAAHNDLAYANDQLYKALVVVQNLTLSDD